MSSVTQKIDRLVDEVSELQMEMTHVREKQVEHSTRFGNGREVMAEIKADIDSLKPKAPDWLKLMLAGLSVVGILMGAQLWMTDRFNARPTTVDVNAMVSPIKTAQKETARDIREIEKHQSAQGTNIDAMKKTQTEQSKDIKTLLERIPAKRPRR